jgi:hypothetical protein
VKSYFLIIILVISSIAETFSQDKKIIGDTTYLESFEQSRNSAFGLNSFTIDTNDFSFRFSSAGQIIEIHQHNDSINGELINFIYQLDRKGSNIKDTIIQRINLSPVHLRNTINIAHRSELRNYVLNDTAKKYFGCGSESFFVEIADSNGYAFRVFYTCFIGTNAEFKTADSLIHLLIDTLKLDEYYLKFKNSLHRGRCYVTTQPYTICYFNNVDIGYLGSTKLPLGYFVNIQIRRFANVFPGVYVQIEHLFDIESNYDFSLTVHKNDLTTNPLDDKSDQLSYRFRRRDMKFLDYGNANINQQFWYSPAI